LTARLELAELATDASFQELSRRSATWLHEAADGPIDVPASWPTPRGSSFRCSQPTPTSRSPLLDTWVASHATTLRRDDDAAFRSWLLARYDELTDPRFERFWTLVGHLNGGPPHPTDANTAAPSRDFAMRSAARSRTFPLMARGTLRVAHRQCCRSYGPSAEGVMSTDRELLVEQERLQGKQPRCAPTSRSMSASSGSARSCSSVAPPSG
jgi:hypothetical protein